jgi:hypothetical protein
VAQCIQNNENWIAQMTQKMFPLPFLDLVLDFIARHEMYSFMDGFNGYNKVKMAKKDFKKPTFILEWGAYAYNVMPFGLCNVPITFFKMITKTFKYVNEFMEVFLDDLIVYNNKEDRFNQLQKCVEKCYVNFALILILKNVHFVSILVYFWGILGV